MLISFRVSVPVPSQWRGLELNTVMSPQFLRAWWFSAKGTSNGKIFCSFVKFAVSFLIFKMIGESAVVIASSLYIFCSFFELKQSAGFILFHVICESNPCGLANTRCRSKYLNFALDCYFFQCF